MAGGYKQFGPTYNATKYVRAAHEGMINGNHDINVEEAEGVDGELAGRIAAITANGVGLANNGKGAVGLFVEDLGDMVNASYKASFYFRGGEYYVAKERTAVDTEVAPGDELTTNESGQLVVLGEQEDAKAVGVVTSVGKYPMGNMYEHVGEEGRDALGLLNGDFVGFILYV